jgi:hypothetical protein
VLVAEGRETEAKEVLMPVMASIRGFSRLGDRCPTARIVVADLLALAARLNVAAPFARAKA